MATKPEHSDEVERLIADARRGCPEALGGAIESLRPELVVVARRELGRDVRAKAGASDIVQETVFKAHRDFAGFRGSTEDQFRAWVMGILRHCALELRRRYRSRGRDARQEECVPDASLLASSTSASGKAIQRERSALLAEALGRLSERERRIVAWRHDEECTFEEMGRRLGCSLVAARAAWLRALEHLREELKMLKEQSSRSGTDT